MVKNAKRLLGKAASEKFWRDSALKIGNGKKISLMQTVDEKYLTDLMGKAPQVTTFESDRVAGLTEKHSRLSMTKLQYRRLPWMR